MISPDIRSLVRSSSPAEELNDIKVIAQDIKNALITAGLIDERYDCLKPCVFISLNETIQKKLAELFDRPLTLRLNSNLSHTFKIRTVIKAILDEVKKLPWSKSLKPQLRGSKVLEVLGPEYADELFKSVGISLPPESLARFKNPKRSFDLDLGIWVPHASEKERLSIAQAVKEAEFKLFRPLTIISDEALREEIERHGFLENPANIVDDKSRYLNTSLGTDEFHVEILWIESFGREEIFRKDALRIDMGEHFFEGDTASVQVTSSTHPLKPFIDLLFGLLTVDHPETVNKRGLARLFLEEIRGKKTIDSKIENHFFITTLFKMPRGVTLAEYLYELILFCHHKHALKDDTAGFFLYLRMAFLLSNKVGQKDLRAIHERDLEEFKKLLPKNLKLEGPIHVLYQLAARPDREMSEVLDLAWVWHERFGLTHKGYQLDMSSWWPRNLFKLSAYIRQELSKNPSLTLLKAAIALYDKEPSQELKETIYAQMGPFLSELSFPVCDLSEVFRNEYQDLLVKFSHPKEALVRAFLRFKSTFPIGIKTLQDKGLHSLIPSLIKEVMKRSVVDAFKMYRTFYEVLTEQDRGQILYQLLGGYIKAQPEERIFFPHDDFTKFIPKQAAFLEENITLDELRECLKSPFMPAIAPFLFQNRFIETETVSLFAQALGLVPLEIVASHTSHLSVEKLETIFSTKGLQPSSSLACLARYALDRRLNIRILFRLIFAFRFTPADLTNVKYERVAEVISEDLERRFKAKEQVGSPSAAIAVQVVQYLGQGGRLALIMLELGFIKEKGDVDAVMPAILRSGTEEVLTRAWKWASQSAFRDSFYSLALAFPKLEEGALIGLRDCQGDVGPLVDRCYSLLRNKDFIPLFHLVRELQSRLSTHPDWVSLLDRIFSSWLDTKLPLTLVQEGLKTYESVRECIQSHELSVYRKVDETKDAHLIGALIPIIKKHHTLLQIRQKDSLYSLFLKALSSLNEEELRKEEAFYWLAQQEAKVPSPSHIDRWASLLSNCRALNTQDRVYPIIQALSPHHPQIKQIQRDILLQSQFETEFVEGIQLGLQIGFSDTSKRHEWFKRLYQIDDELGQKFALKVTGWFHNEIEDIFDWLTLHYHTEVSFETLIDAGFFDVLKSSPRRNQLFAPFFNHGDDLVFKIEYGLKPLFKAFLEQKEGYSYLICFLDECLTQERYEVIRDLAKFRWQDSQKSQLLTECFQFFPDLDIMISLYTQILPVKRRALLKEWIDLIRVSDEPTALATSLLNMALHRDTPFEASEEIEEAIGWVCSDQSASQFFPFLNAYINKWAFDHNYKEGDIIFRPVDLSASVDTARYSKASNLVIGIYAPSIHASLKVSENFYAFYNRLMKKIIQKIYHDRKNENRGLLDWLAQSFYALSKVRSRLIFPGFLINFNCFTTLKIHQEQIIEDHLRVCKWLYSKINEEGHFENQAIGSKLAVWLGAETSPDSVPYLQECVEFLEHFDKEDSFQSKFNYFIHILALMRPRPLSHFTQKQYLRNIKTIGAVIADNPGFLSDSHVRYANIFNSLMLPCDTLDSVQVDMAYEALIAIKNSMTKWTLSHPDDCFEAEIMFMQVALEKGYISDAKGIMFFEKYVTSTIEKLNSIKAEKPLTFQAASLEMSRLVCMQLPHFGNLKPEVKVDLRQRIMEKWFGMSEIAKPT